GSTFFNVQNMVGSNFADGLTGDGNNNMLDGDGGGDVLAGGGGNDTYVFKRGYGQLVINNGVQGNGIPSSTLSMGSGISPDSLWFSRSGDDLIVQILGSSDRITVKRWFLNTYQQLQSIELAGNLRIGAQSVNALVSALAAYQSANPAFDSSIATQLPPSI